MTDDKCAVEIEWAGGKQVFSLNSPWVRRVLDYRGINGSPPAACLARFQSDQYSLDDIERVIELGALGGGMGEREVEAMLDAHVRGQPVAPNAVLANQILAALFVGTATPETEKEAA
jgi:hypothetical protein